MSKLIHFAKKNLYLNCPETEKAKSTLEYNEAIWCHGITEYKNGIELYAASSVYEKIPELKVPTLFLGSTDDPFTLKDCMSIKEIEKSENAALVSVPQINGLCKITTASYYMFKFNSMNTCEINHQISYVF